MRRLVNRVSNRQGNQRHFQRNNRRLSPVACRHLCLAHSQPVVRLISLQLSHRAYRRSNRAPNPAAFLPFYLVDNLLDSQLVLLLVFHPRNPAYNHLRPQACSQLGSHRCNRRSNQADSHHQTLRRALQSYLRQHRLESQLVSLLNNLQHAPPIIRLGAPAHVQPLNPQEHLVGFPVLHRLVSPPKYPPRSLQSSRRRIPPLFLVVHRLPFHQMTPQRTPPLNPPCRHLDNHLLLRRGDRPLNRQCNQL